MDRHRPKRAIIDWWMIPSLMAASLGVIAGFCFQVQGPDVGAASPKTMMATRGSAVLVDTSMLNMLDAKRAITGRNLRVHGTPVDADPNNGTLELKAKDGTIAVSGVRYPPEIGRLMQEGLHVQVEIEGGIKRRKVNNNVTFYVSEVRRITWEARDESGTVVHKGERKGTQ